MPTLKEAEERLARLPTLKATFVGMVMGIIVSLIAQLALKPLSIGSDVFGNYTIRVADQVTGTVVPLGYFGLVTGGLGISIFLWWFVQKWMAGVTGWTSDDVEHGVGSDKLTSFMVEVDTLLSKLKMHGYEIHSHPTDDGSFVRAIKSAYDEEDTVTLKIEPFMATVQAKAAERLSLEAAKMSIDCLKESAAKWKKGMEPAPVRTF